jgi:hypothetical protein
MLVAPSDTDLNARNLLFHLGWRMHWRAGLGRGKGGAGKAEMLKTGTLKGRMLRITPESGGTGVIKAFFT